MAGLNIVIRTDIVTTYVTEKTFFGGHTKTTKKSVLESQDGKLVFLMSEGNNNIPHVHSVHNTSTGEPAFFEGRASGYVGVSLKDLGEGEFALSIGTPDHAYSIPVAEWACELAQAGVGLLRADKEASLEGEAADVHERALSLPQVGIESDLTVRNNEEGHKTALAVTTGEKYLRDRVRRSVYVEDAEEVLALFRDRVYRVLYASSMKDSWAFRVARAAFEQVEAEEERVHELEQAAEELPRLRERYEHRVTQLEEAWSEKKVLQTRIEELEAQLEEAKAFDAAELSKMQLFDALKEKGLSAHEARDVIQSL